MSNAEFADKKISLSGARAQLVRAMQTMQNTVSSARLPLLNGALTRFGVVLALFPLDVAKTRAQLRTAHTVPHPLSLLKGRGHLLKNQIHVFRGAPAAMLGVAGAGVLSYIVYTSLAKSSPTATVSTSKGTGLPEKTESRNILFRNIMTAEIAAAAWLVPLESAKVRVQAGVHSTVLRAFRASFRSPQALYSGFGAHLARELPSRMLQFAAVALVAKAVTYIAPNERKGKWWDVVDTAAAAAVVGFATAPLDLVRTRVMAQRVGPGSLHYNFVNCAVDVVRKEGAPALFRGMGPRIAYMALSAGLFMVGFEATERALKERQWLWYRPDVWVEDVKKNGKKA